MRNGWGIPICETIPLQKSELTSFLHLALLSLNTWVFIKGCGEKFGSVWDSCPNYCCFSASVFLEVGVGLCVPCRSFYRAGYVFPLQHCFQLVIHPVLHLAVGWAVWTEFEPRCLGDFTLWYLNFGRHCSCRLTAPADFHPDIISLRWFQRCGPCGSMATRS